MPQRPPALVTVEGAITRDVPFYLDEIGNCTAREVVSIRPQASGQITRIHFADGADVNTGDMLFTIDPRPYQAALDQAKASLAQNEASLSLANSEFERAKKLLPIRAISREEYESKENAIEVSRAQIKTAQAAIVTAEVSLDYCFIRSPINGRAGQRQIDIGNAVTANSGTVLLTIQRLDPIYADFTVTERDLAAVRRQMANKVLKTYVRLPDEDWENARQGELTFLDNAVQNATGTVKLRATMPNQDRHFWPGQFVEVRLVLDTLKNAVLVPSSSVQMSQKGPFVYVLKDDMTAELRLVKPGQFQGRLIVISEGVKQSEKIITNGQLTVTPGGKVRLQGPPPPGAGKPGEVKT